MKFKVAEVFASIQGEGKFMGTPSVFVRLFGCNFTCGGFGMPKGQKSHERDNIDPEKYDRLEDLPLVSTGCDSYASWDPRFKKFSKMYTVSEIVDMVRDVIPSKQKSNYHVIFTGGEPLLRGWQKGMPDLITQLNLRLGIDNITFETNGTQTLTPEFESFLMSSQANILFSVSPKLSPSGEEFEDAIQPSVVNQYYKCGEDVTFKYVIAETDDIKEVEQANSRYFSKIPKWFVTKKTYLMPVGGMSEMYEGNAKNVAKMALENGYNYSPRLHIDVFGNAWGT